MPEIQVRVKTRLKGSSSRLNKYRANIKSQFGEDGIIVKIFDIISPANCFCVEFGAWDGIHLSNTSTLINGANWSGILIEGSTDKFFDLEKTYCENDRVQTLNRFVAFGEDSLDNILATTNTPIDFDFLSIDIDGNDWHVWESLQNYRPRVVAIEFNPTVQNDVYFVQDRDLSIHHGASLMAMIELGKKKGYEIVAVTTVNAFFVIREEYEKLDIEDNDIDAIYDGSAYQTRLFQGYDGTLIIAGCSKLIWKDIPFSSEDIQVLPSAMRKYFEPEPDDKSGRAPAWRPNID